MVQTPISKLNHEEIMASRPRDKMPSSPPEDQDNASLHTEETTPGAQPPIEIDGIKLGKPHTSAAGVEGVRQSLRYVWRRMGVAEGTKAHLKLNEVDGFDCRSCAWPSPDEHRHVAEFCESGAKAVSDEGTRKRITPEIFNAHSISDLLKRSAYWLNEQGRLTSRMIKRVGSNRYERISWEE